MNHERAAFAAGLSFGDRSLHQASAAGKTPKTAVPMRVMKSGCDADAQASTGTQGTVSRSTMPPRSPIVTLP